MAQTKKTGTRRKPAARTAAARTANQARTHSTRRKAGIAAAAAIGTLAAGALAVLRLGLADRIAARRGTGGEHAAPDLAPEAPTPGTTRSPEAFRPDPTAAVPASERASLAPATGPAPSLASTAGEMANQTAPANG